MPELPEVEILARHLRPALDGQTIRRAHVLRKKVVSPTAPAQLERKLKGATFTGLSRRGKYLLFQLRSRAGDGFMMLGHLGMTGRMYLAAKSEPLPKHAAVVLELGARNFVYEDTRHFGRFTLDLSAVEKLGPEPLDREFTAEAFGLELKRSRQPIKVKLLDQTLVAGVGNIYASEALFLAGISPRRPVNRLTRLQTKALWQAIRKVLNHAIKFGSTVPLNFEGAPSDGLFYYGSMDGKGDFYSERLRVYDRRGQPCPACQTPVERIVQAARSTFYCPRCQRG
jgi:formamidopyrimidine-DNA glycosylase